MDRIPVIVGFGGVNAAGRSSGHHGYRRTIVDSLDPESAAAMWRSLAGLVGHDGPLDAEAIERLAVHSLVRTLEPQVFDPEAAPWNRKVQLSNTNGPVSFEVSKRQLPDHLPDGWSVEQRNGTRVRIVIGGGCELLVPDRREIGVGAAGMVPQGFDPKAHYAARSHPRALQLTVFGASDALGSIGIDWPEVLAHVPPDQIATYAGSALAQLDEAGNGGLLGNRHRGKRITSKHLAMGLGEMAADFTNAYVLGSLGQTGHNMGACATFLYNLRLGSQEIREGRARVVFVGGVDAPLLPDVMDGLATMGALATDSSLLEIEGKSAGDKPDHRRACRPFGNNSGFVVGEGVQFLVLMDGELALELGADVHGGVGDVFVHADGHKKSISAPGVGNYVTFAKAVASAGRAVGEVAVRDRSFVHAHGTGTPQNRTSESQILDAVARAFDIEEWPVAAIKCYVGHTMAGAGGDQIVSALGTWRHGLVPGIRTIDAVAPDVSGERLRISRQHLDRGVGGLDVAFVNSKGFGGNNATAWVTAPHVAERQLETNYGAASLDRWRRRVEATRRRAAEHDRAASAGEPVVVYKFDHEVRDASHVRVEKDRVEIEGFAPIQL
jgi:acetoacetyl-[acyl-carrier protein] synthase